MKKKNVIIIMIDGGRLDFATNSEVFTKLRNQSVFFSQSITYGPHTIAAMHAVFSGTYGTRTGTNSYYSTFKFKKDKFKTLTEYLNELNYYTHSDAINRLVIPKQGFDKHIVHDEENDDLLERHIDIIHEVNAMSKKHKNFFIYLHYSKIHTGIMNEVLKVYDNFSEDFFKNKKLNQKRYAKLFKGAENYLQGILNEIYQLGLNENSIILVMSDHGISVGEKLGERAYAAYCYDYTLRTFTYFIIPGIQSREITQQVRTIDIMPTLLDYLEIPLDNRYNTIDGVSLLPLIQGKSIPEFYAFSETGNPLREESPPEEPNVKSIRNSNWKLILNEYNNSKELYNLKLDPNENSNLYNTGEPIEDMLWEELNKIMKKHD